MAVDIHGEVYAIARYCGVKTKEVKARLGLPEFLPSVDETKAKIKSALRRNIRHHFKEANIKQKAEMVPLIAKHAHMKHSHNIERAELAEKLETRRNLEQRQRNQRLRSGMAGLWDMLTGKAAEIKRRNEREAYRCYSRDKAQRERLFIAQMKDRQALQREIKAIRDKHRDARLSLKSRIQHLTQRNIVLHPRNRSGPKLER